MFPEIIIVMQLSKFYFQIRLGLGNQRSTIDSDSLQDDKTLHCLLSNGLRYVAKGEGDEIYERIDASELQVLTWIINSIKHHDVHFGHHAMMPEMDANHDLPLCNAMPCIMVIGHAVTVGIGQPMIKIIKETAKKRYSVFKADL